MSNQMITDRPPMLACGINICVPNLVQHSLSQETWLRLWGSKERADTQTEKLGWAVWALMGQNNYVTTRNHKSIMHRTGPGLSCPQQGVSAGKQFQAVNIWAEEAAAAGFCTLNFTLAPEKGGFAILLNLIHIGKALSHSPWSWGTGVLDMDVPMPIIQFTLGFLCSPHLEGI